MTKVQDRHLGRAAWALIALSFAGALVAAAPAAATPSYEGVWNDMIVTEKGSFSIRFYLTEDGIALADRMRVVLYKDLAHMRRLPLGTWVFTEPDQLDAPRRELARLVAERLTASGAGVRILNDPRQVRLRADLLGAANRRHQ